MLQLFRLQVATSCCMTCCDCAACNTPPLHWSINLAETTALAFGQRVQSALLTFFGLQIAHNGTRLRTAQIAHSMEVVPLPTQCLCSQQRRAIASALPPCYGLQVKPSGKHFMLAEECIKVKVEDGKAQEMIVSVDAAQAICSACVGT